jgi:hypothetical protein
MGLLHQPPTVVVDKDQILAKWLEATQQRAQRKLSQCRRAHHNPICARLGVNPVLQYERPATNRLSYGMANSSLKMGHKI